MWKNYFFRISTIQRTSCPKKNTTVTTINDHKLLFYLQWQITCFVRIYTPIKYVLDNNPEPKLSSFYVKYFLTIYIFIKRWMISKFRLNYVGSSVLSFFFFFSKKYPEFIKRKNFVHFCNTIFQCLNKTVVILKLKNYIKETTFCVIFTLQLNLKHICFYFNNLWNFENFCSGNKWKIV